MSARPRLIALDADDLAVISAHVQDAAVNVADIVWRQNEKRLVVALQQPGETVPQLSALRFERVLACKSRAIDLDARDKVLSLVGIVFHPADPPAGNAMLMFDGGGALRLDLECLECELAALGEDDLGVLPDPPAETGL